MLKLFVCIFLIFLSFSIIAYSSPVEITIDYGNCTESWSCGNWGACSGGIQTRDCTDANNCGTTINESATSQTCTSGTPSGPSGSGGPVLSGSISGTPVKIGNKTMTKPKPYVPPKPELKESDFLKMEMVAPDEVESGEPISVVLTLTASKALETTVEVLGEEQNVSLQSGESKTLDFIVYTPEINGTYDLVATTPYATANKTINLIWKPLFLYVTPMGNQVYEIHLKNFENKSTTEIEVTRGNEETVFVDVLSGEIDYRVNLTLTPGEYTFDAKAFSGPNLLDEDMRILKVEGNPVFNYGMIILAAVVIVILIASIILFRVKKVS